MEKYIYQMFILGTDNLDKILPKGLGGVIFFSKDIQTKTQIISEIKKIKSKSLIQPFISIDQEGGRVERTEKIYPKKLSPKQAYEKGKEFLELQTSKIAKEISELGFNLNFAPCIDVNTNSQNPIIGERAFADNPIDVINGMNIYIKELRKYNIIPCVKHFPGHGDAEKDSHLTLPQINLSMQEMENIHIKPFKFAINNNIEMIMVAHLHCTCFDENTIPTSLSCNTINYLRNNLKYQGVLISDDMIMKGVQNYGSLEACVMGIKAGLDMFIFRNSDNNTLEMIEKLITIVDKDETLKQKVLQSYDRITTLKKLYNLI